MVPDNLFRIGVYLFNKDKQQQNVNLLKQNFIDFRERSKTIEWLTIIGVNFGLLEKTLGLAVECFDVYIQSKGGYVPPDDYQYVGLASLFMASKYEEIYPPTAHVSSLIS
jgi:hypothetical protein